MTNSRVFLYLIAQSFTERKYYFFFDLMKDAIGLTQAIDGDGDTYLAIYKSDD